MSKFLERLKQLSEGSPQPMGFHSIGMAKTRLKLQLLAVTAPTMGDDAAVHFKQADAGCMRLGKGFSSEKMKKAGETAAIPWGVWAEDETGAVESLKHADYDFVVFQGGMPVAADFRKESGKFLEVENSIGDTLLRSLVSLPVDALVLADETPNPLTWRDLMTVQRIAGISNKPVLAVVSLAISAKELQSLWQAGVDGVVVFVSDAEDAAALKTLRQAIAGLDYPAPLRKDRGLAIAPRPQPSPEPEEVEDDDD
jgi:hypothetical protein